MKKIYNIKFVILVLILSVIESYFLVDWFKFEYSKSNLKKQNLAEISLLDKTEQIYDLNYYKEYYNNEDIIGTVEIENTNLKTLLVQSNNNTYYLNHSLYKKYDKYGSVFVDSRTDLNSKQINIYGHNSTKYDVKFKELENYLDKDYYEKHKYIKLWDGIVFKEYEIFSVNIVTNDFEHMDVKSNNWSEHIKLLSKSIYDTDVKVTKEDNILVLQTCNYKPRNSFLIISAREMGEK